MRKFTVAQTSEDPEKSPSWYIDIDGCRERQYSTQWAAIVGAFVAAHETYLHVKQDERGRNTSRRFGCTAAVHRRRISFPLVRILRRGYADTS